MSGLFDSAYKSLGYLVSLPERTIRSLAAVAGGTTSLLTETLFPDVLRGTTLYKIFLGDTQRFVIERVAQVQREAGDTAGGGGAAAPEDFVQRKIAGTALEAAGFGEVYNQAEGFEGPLDERFRRGTMAGWRFHGLPWEQL